MVSYDVVPRILNEVNPLASLESPRQEDVDTLLAAKDSLLVRCRSTIEELHKEIDKEKQQRELLKKNLTEIREEIEEYKSMVEEKQVKVEKAENLNRTLIEELETSKRQVQQLSVKVNELRTTQELNAKELELNKSQLSIKESNEELLKMIDEKDRQIKELIHIIEGLEGKLNETEEKNRVILVQLDKVNTQSQVQHNELIKINNDLKRLLQENQSLKDSNKVIIEEMNRKVLNKEKEVKELMNLKKEEWHEKMQLRENELKESTDQVKSELSSTVKQMVEDNNNLRKENLDLRNEVFQLKNSYEKKLKQEIQESYDKNQKILALEKQIEEYKLAKYKATEERKEVIIEELKQNKEEINAIKKEYREEINKLSNILSTLSINNERLTEKYNDSMSRLNKANEVIEEYKKIVDNVNKLKEEKMEDLMVIESENGRLKKTIEVSVSVIHRMRLSIQRCYRMKSIHYKTN
jgi:DNA repair exonuclease SbcCD ATPase subunit